jgi:uncharacterized protein YjiS (DUF1127 family)
MASLFSSLLSSMTERLENWRARERAYRELSALDDRSLADIGLTRSDIPFVLKGKLVEREAPRIEPTFANLNHRRAA